MFTQAAQELTTVRDILRFAVSRFNDAGLFFGHGSDNAHDEAAYLILHTLNLPLDTLEPYLDAKLLQSEKEEVLAVLERRAVEHIPAAEIDAVDLSLDALEVAAINIEDYGLEEHINLIHTDLFEGLEDTYDLIVSNPPYVDAESVDMLPDEYLHEPELALGSGEDGLDATRQILLHAAKYLNPKGVLLVEIGHNRDVLEAAYPELPFTWLETSGGDGFVFLLTREQLLGLE